MINLIRVLVIIVLLSPPLALGILNLTGAHVPVELLIVTLVASLVAIIFWAALTTRFSRLQHLTTTVQAALDKDQETYAAMVEPFHAKPTGNDPSYLTMLELAERLSERRHQLRDTIDKLAGILRTLSQGKSLDTGTGEFDVPDQDDRTLLLGTLCQLISSMQHSKQRGDVFANVLRESPIAMLITDADYKIRSINPAAEKLFGFTLQQLLHHSIVKFFVPPPLKSHHSHLKKVVLNGKEALEALKNGRQEVFTTIGTGYGKILLIGLRASFGTHCLFVIRERSKDKVDLDKQVPETVHFEDGMPTVTMGTPVVAS